MRNANFALVDANGAPLVWAVHLISPSTYDEDRWHRFVADVLAMNVGVICCFSAAIEMRQLRGIHSPTYNSIPRLPVLAAAGVPVPLGSNNVADMCSPSTTMGLTDEVFVLSCALRYYKTEILAKFATGSPLAQQDREVIRTHLETNDEDMARRAWRFRRR